MRVDRDFIGQVNSLVDRLGNRPPLYQTLSLADEIKGYEKLYSDDRELGLVLLAHYDIEVPVGLENAFIATNPEIIMQIYSYSERLTESEDYKTSQNIVQKLYEKKMKEELQVA